MFRKIPKRSVYITPGEFGKITSLVKDKACKAGPFIAKFEDRFNQYIGTKEAIAFSSGRFALYLTLKHFGLKKGDKIIVSAYNFKGVPEMLLKEGFVPLFVDADKDTYQIDIKDIEERIDKDTKAIIITHLFGQPCDLKAILAVAKKYNLLIIEDCAHALGSYYQEKHVGSFGDVGFFSFTGSKMLNTSFGGMLVTSNTDLATKIRRDLLSYNFPNIAEVLIQRLITYFYSIYSNKYCYSAIFYPLTLLINLINLDPLEVYKSIKGKEVAEKKMKFSNLQAMIGFEQMDYIDQRISKRKKIINSLIKNLDPSISIQSSALHSDPCCLMFPIKTKNKSEVFRKLIFKGIDTNLSYVSDCSNLIKASGSPNAKFLSESILSMNLPFDLSEGEVVYIARALNDIKNFLY